MFKSVLIFIYTFFLSFDMTLSVSIFICKLISLQSLEVYFNNDSGQK